MKVAEIQKKARKLGLNDINKYKKSDLIKAIQRKEGNFDCFGTAVGCCEQSNCLWIKDCLK